MKGAVILDRDGVINDHRDYVNTPEDLVLFPFAAEAIRLLNERGFAVYVATNQGGVGLGYSTEAMLKQIHAKMVSDLAAQGAHISGIAACIHAPKAGCSCRKPKPGLLLELQATYGFDLSASYMVGDRETDVEAGKAAGAKTVFIGDGPTSADFKAPDLLAAARCVLEDTVAQQ